MSCETGYLEFDIPRCDDIVLTGLTASTLMKAVIHKPGASKKYETESTTDADGVLTLDKDLYPAGYFNTGYLFIQLFKKDGDDNFTVIELIGTRTGGLMHLVDTESV